MLPYRRDRRFISAAGVPTAFSGSPFVSESNCSLTSRSPPATLPRFRGRRSPGRRLGAFTTHSTGALTAVLDSPFTIPGRTVADSQPLGLVDTGSYVYAALSPATSQIAGFSIASGTGALTPVPGSPFSAGTNPTAVVSAGNFLYVINPSNGSISSDSTISGYKHQFDHRRADSAFGLSFRD